MNPQNSPESTSDSALGEQIVAALEFGPAQRTQEIEPLCLGSLWTETVDCSVSHILGRLDRSGRVSARSLLALMGWRTGEVLTVRSSRGRVLFVRSCSGPEHVRSSRFVVIPVSVRTAAGIEVGELVLISAVPQHDLIIVHSQRVLESMVLEQVRRGPGR
ncbi:hypothetical protein [Amycolatopsis sp. NPDC051061]|uniref:hypothetical protein n=1 Tax=Amycolatopsis sp. NPDC051061 TaxID=3155042 RepID=UPI00344AFE63